MALSFSYHPSEKTLQTELRSEDYLPGGSSVRSCGYWARATLRHPRGFFVRRSAVAPRHRRLQHSQVHAQLRAVMRRVGDEDRAKDRSARPLENDLVAQSQRPRRSRPLPRQLPKNPLDLRAQLVEQFHALGAIRKLCLRPTPGQSIVFVGRQHQDSETWELRDMTREVAERA